MTLGVTPGVTLYVTLGVTLLHNGKVSLTYCNTMKCKDGHFEDVTVRVTLDVTPSVTFRVTEKRKERKNPPTPPKKKKKKNTHTTSARMREKHPFSVYDSSAFAHTTPDGFFTSNHAKEAIKRKNDRFMAK